MAKYKWWIFNQILKASDLDLCLKVIDLFEETNELIDELKMDFSNQEEQFARQLIATQEILYPKLLINDHKTIKKGDSPQDWWFYQQNLPQRSSRLVNLGLKGFWTSRG